MTKPRYYSNGVSWIAEYNKNVVAETVFDGELNAPTYFRDCVETYLREVKK